MEKPVKNVLFSAASVVAIALSTHYMVEQNQVPNPYWGEKTMERAPASFDLSIDPSYYRDFFLPDRYDNFIDYDVSIRFSTDKDKSYMRRNAKLALHEAFSQTFSQINAGERPSEQMLALLKENAISSFMDKFVKRLRFYKILDGNFQIDFIFTPKEVNSLELKEEMRTNQLVHHDMRGDLYKKLTDKDRTIPETMENNPLPNNGEIYQFSGGAISINLELADTNLVFKIPRPTKNILKGHVLFRKYYRVNERGMLKVAFRRENFQADMVHFKKDGKAKERYVTADLYKTFNLKNPLPKLDRMEVSFGKIKDLPMQKRNLWDRFSGFFSSEDKETADLDLYGKYRGREYKATIEKLVYDFNDSEFTYSSKVNIEIPGSFDNTSKEMSFKNRVRTELIKQSRTKLIEQLHLEELHTKF
ncbi:hypothetical protein HBN50_12765 [Halobacteriovorax sp. GB3]|uniref:hypothetical protein n=1 Tax=Halobacteriovorax sp. GB3 TaxID=2719615 RepID=UPI00235E610B|nr:hypothetical protein [Halobacteriovorax sp. GB3]MDD0853977.1 hypothetical protein [Halobacteriovorax sp. GB3]